MKTERERGGKNTLIFGDNLRFLTAGRLLGTSVPGGAAILEQMVCMNISLVCVYVSL